MIPIILNVGISEDPFPEDEKTTPYWVYSDACSFCGCDGRLIVNVGRQVVLVCENCFDEFQIGLDADKFCDITYVYWCNRSQFKEDYVDLEKNVVFELEALLNKYPDVVEIPRWAVKIIGGICQKSDKCINRRCIYNNIS